MQLVERARLLYDAFARSDVAALAAALHPDVVGDVTRGLPHELGGVHRGPEAMLRMWGRAGRKTPFRPVPDEITPLTDGRLLAIGRYVGGGHEAAFAHVLTFEGDLVVRIVQITDSAIWHQAAAQVA
ncbi:MAG: nuclear transport factor 2 family protein [Polyangiaceae bacterium]